MAGLEALFSDEACAEALCDEQFLAGMARFEGALARACATAGLIPATDADQIFLACERARFDGPQLARAARAAGALAIPFVKALTQQVESVSPSAARHVHFGATSQDVQDTALVLCVRQAAWRIEGLVVSLGDAAAILAKAHARTPCAARTLLQPALPVPFGWKAAVWLAMLARSLSGFRSAASQACTLQFGGAGGTLSAFGPQAAQVEQALAAQLALPVPSTPWHSARDNLARLGAEAAILAGVAAKVARDVSLLMQPEIGEVAEPAAGGSSSMPHKRNPAGSLLALEAAQRAPGLASTLMVQLSPEHERGIGQWQSQWLTLRELLGASASAVASMASVLQGLRVNSAAMLANLERSNGLVYSERIAIRLARSAGKKAAHAWTEELCARATSEGRRLQQVMEDDPRVRAAIPQSEMPGLFDPCGGDAGAQSMIVRALAEWDRARTTSG